jgi:hypothetical protein
MTTTIDDLIYYAKNFNFKSDIVSSDSEESKSSHLSSAQDDVNKKTINYFVEPYNNGVQNDKI